MSAASGRLSGPSFPADRAERVRGIARGELTPVTPRRAATVMLVQDASAGGGLDIHLLRRSPSMAFAGGVYAYPGGGVDPRDSAPVGWAGPDRFVWARRLGLGPGQEAAAQAIVCAAVRETFEEAGVLLAGPDPDTVVVDTTGDDWEADRRALVEEELSFADFLTRRSLVVRSDLLGFWARWITPDFEVRRFDTFFFVAAVPEGQRARNASTEADHTVWLPAREVVESYDRSELPMMPPTIATLRALAPHSSVADALTAAESRDPSPVQAKAELVADQVVLRWPGHDDFEMRLDTV